MSSNDAVVAGGFARARSAGRGRTSSAAARFGALALGFAIALAGCGFVNTDDGGGGGEGGPGKGAGGAKVTAYVNTEQNTGLAKLIAAYERSSGTTVDISSAETSELNEQLRIQLTSGTAADLIRVSPGYSSPVAAGVLGTAELADLSDASWVDAIPDDTAALATVDGKTLAFPVSRNAIIMAYNKKVFADADVEVPTTWSELLAACDKLEAAGVTPISTPLQDGIYLQFWMYALAATLVYAENPDLDEQMAAGNVDFVDNKPWNDVYAKFLSLRDAGYVSEGSLGIPFDQGMQSVATGESAMILMVSGGLPQLYGYAENGAEDFEVFALPATDNAADTHLPLAPDFMAVNAAADNVDAAKDFLEFLAKPENVEAYATTLGVLPGLDVEVDLGETALQPVLPLFDEGRTAPFANYLWPNGDTQQTLLQSGQELFDGKITTKELLTQMDADYDKGTP
ncbi:ABC transporter substrate-binding protein [Actinopolymorpha sp. B17G11]|uniref:ABC transporter substrate-binding protein n=1 Tax=unclassified Actinopolymorpha TaxID=2627063 RepID=UPI0032D94CCF